MLAESSYLKREIQHGNRNILDIKTGRVAMRRKDKEITDRESIDAIMDEAEVCRVAFADHNVPYIVPMSFGYRDGHLFFHSATEGKKLEMLARNGSVCFEMESRVEMIRDGNNPCECGVRYFSVIGHGTAHIIENAQEKKAGLDVIMHKYFGPDQYNYKAEMVDRVVIIRVDISSLTAKKSGW
jgi:nitroimidazol reductase NimA-like FMN-containing flavoprotein (pyridoxamine 5'-phosphate oxidase superfamily)